MIFSFITVDKITQRISLKGPYLDGVFPEEDPSLYQLRRVLGSLDIPWFSIRITRIPQTREYVAVEKGGTITRFSWDDTDQTRVVLDMQDIVMDKGESGFLDIAFHPQFHNQSSEHYREIYLAYNYAFDPEDENRNFLRLSKFYFDEDLNAIDRNSEVILIQQYAQNPNHNASKLFFDEEEYLYFTIGDEGGANDLYRNAQVLNKELFAGIIRIDVNNDLSRSHPIRRQPFQSEALPPGYPASFTQHYSIPDDNPFVDESGAFMEEFYVIGLRNPFTATLDPEIEGIWVGDVGQEDQEEISLVTRGSNAQWPYMEGEIRHKDPPRVIFGTETPPVITHGRGEAKSIICGYVYRGETHSELNNTLIYGDFITGNIWSYDLVSETSKVLSIGGKQVLQFFEGPDDDIYVLALGGELYRLEPPVAAEIPALLSETGAFEDLATLTPSSGIVPYEVNSPLWSDAAEKLRWVAIPDRRPVAFEYDDPWTFRSGTVFIKHFEMDMGLEANRRLETRFLINDTRGRAYGLSYKWNEEGTDAILIGTTEAPIDTLQFLDGSRRAWNYPTRSQCLQCHTQDAGFVLGVKTAQLNGPIIWNDEHHESQVELWQELGLFTERSNLDNLPKMVAVEDTTAHALTRFKSYLDANCASCHRPEGVAPQFDARFSTPIEDQELIFKITEGFNSIESNHLITPGDTTTSEVFRRDVEALASWRMPPLARNMVDTTYINFLKEFIVDLGAPVEYVRDTVCEGEIYFFRDSTSLIIEDDFYDSIQYTGSLGIDSLVIYDLTAITPETQFVSDSVCFGGTYVFPSGETMTGITRTVLDSSWVQVGEVCNFIITQLEVKHPNQPCEVIPLEISFGPNPVDYDYFILSSNLELDEVGLTDLLGKPVDITEISGYGDGFYQVILPTTLVDGLYILTVRSGDQKQARRLVLDR